MQYSHIPTLFGAIIVASLALAIPMAWAMRADRDGLGVWAVALCTEALGFGLFAVRGVIPDWVSILLGNGLISLALSVFLVAVYRFQATAVNHVAAWVPPVAQVFGLFLMMDDLQSRVIYVSLACVFQVGLIGMRLVRYTYDFPMRGRNLVIAGMACYVVVAVARCWSVVFDPEAIRAFLQQSPIQTITYFVVFGAIIVTSIGFMLMAKERSDERLRNVAMRDSLTGCWNRIRIEEVAEQEMARLRRYGHPACAILIDIDHFKLINDRYGHGAGDDVLVAFARIAESSLRATDILGRWGGEEFMIILPMSDLPEAVMIAERLRANVEGNVFSRGIRMTISLGIAAGLSTDQWSDWFGRADVALYCAKGEGRNRTRVEGIQLTHMPDDTRSPHILQLVWREAYACGNATIDREHRNLFDVANVLLALGGTQASKAEISAAARDFVAATRRHFAGEERIVAAASYTGADDHARIHHELLAHAETLLEQFERDEIAAATIFHFVVHDFFANHILVEDIRFSDALAPSHKVAERAP